jgi:hypothetical protein
MVTSESNLFFDPIHRQKQGRFQMALVKKPLCRNWPAASSEQFVNLRLQMRRRIGQLHRRLLFHCPWFRPLLGALRTAQQYAPQDMFD